MIASVLITNTLITKKVHTQPQLKLWSAFLDSFLTLVGGKKISDSIVFSGCDR